MKVLISNYNNNGTTESSYLNTVLNMIDCKSSIWPNNLSTYDAFDIMKPDLHITHHTLLSQDLAFYLKENKNIDLIVNITGITQDNLTHLESIFTDFGINVSFFFVNRYDHGLVSRKNNILTILPGADLFLGSEPQRYEIDYGIFVNDKSQINPIGDTYHYITNDQKIEKDADIFLPVEKLNHLYHNYNSIVIKYFDNVFPQLFFDAALKVPVYFDSPNKNELNSNLKKLLGDDSYCNLDNKDSGNISDKIKSKHTCLHRTKSLLSQLSCKDYTDKLQSIIERSVK